MKTNRNGEWFQIICPKKWDGLSIDYVLRQVWVVSKKLIHHMRMNKEIKINNKEANWNAPLHINDKIEIKLFHKEDFGVIPSFYPIQVIYEDDHLLVVNKPYGMDTHPNSIDQINTLTNAVAYYLKENGQQCNVKHIHRLDKDTTGAILFAKHALAGTILDKMLEKRLIKRTYIALVHGCMTKKKGTINKPIGRDRHHPTRRRVSSSGQEAITHYEVLKWDQNKNLTLIKCHLDTGRTHQIRVHLSHIGHPLAGDILYGGKPIFKRQALHAIKLAFQHPLNDEEIICMAPFLDQPQIFDKSDSYSI